MVGTDPYHGAFRALRVGALPVGLLRLGNQGAVAAVVLLADVRLEVVELDVGIEREGVELFAAAQAVIVVTTDLDAVHVLDHVPTRGIEHDLDSELTLLGRAVLRVERNDPHLAGLLLDQRPVALLGILVPAVDEDRLGGIRLQQPDRRGIRAEAARQNRGAGTERQDDEQSRNSTNKILPHCAASLNETTPQSECCHLPVTFLL